MALWLGCTSQVSSHAQGRPGSNWTSADAPCAKYDDLRKTDLGDIGVKIDAVSPWADTFRRAISFWNTVLDANFHEQTDLNACAVRIINGSDELLEGNIIARSQFPTRDKFRGMIAVWPNAASSLSFDEMYATAIHELGHILGLVHNPNPCSVMYHVDVDGTAVLDSKDTGELLKHHKLRPNILSMNDLAVASVRRENIRLDQRSHSRKPERRRE